MKNVFEKDSQIKEIITQMIACLDKVPDLTVDEVQFFDFKSFKNKQGDKKQAIRHRQKTNEYSKVYVGDDRGYNFTVMVIGESFTILDE